MVKIWGSDATGKDLMLKITNGMNLDKLDCYELCKAYNIELASYPLSAVVQRGNGRVIYRPTKFDKRDLIEVLIDSYLLKLYDPNYILLSLTASLLSNGGNPDD